MNQQTRTTLKLLGYCLRLFFIILFVVFLWRHADTIKPCYIQHPNGTIEYPGLYGNCDYMNQYINKQTITDMNIKNNTVITIWTNKTKN